MGFPIRVDRPPALRGAEVVAPYSPSRGLPPTVYGERHATFPRDEEEAERDTDREAVKGLFTRRRLPCE